MPGSLICASSVGFFTDERVFLIGFLLLVALLALAFGLACQIRKYIRQIHKKELSEQSRIDDYIEFKRRRASEHRDATGVMQISVTQNYCTGTMLFPSDGHVGSFSGTLGSFSELVCPWLHPSDSKRFADFMSCENLTRTFDSGSSAVSADFLIALDGMGYKWYRVYVELARNPKNQELEAVAYSMDINTKKRLEQIGRKLINDDFYSTGLIDVKTGTAVVIRTNASLSRAFTCEKDEKDLNYDSRISSDLSKIMIKQEFDDIRESVSLSNVIKKLEARKSYSITLRAKGFGDDFRYLKLRYSYLSELHESIMLTVEEISDIISSQMDVTTGLYNATGFVKRAKKWMAENPGRRYRVQRYDIDGFKNINGAFGYKAGNEFLREFGLFMHERNTENSFAAHLSSDHFVRFCSDDSESPEDAYRSFDEHFNNGRYRIPITMHIGVYDLCEPECDPMNMSYKALLALQSIKGDFSRHIAYYERGLIEHTQEQLELLGEVERAIGKKQFEVWFQPQFDYETQSLVGAEALVRWRHPERGLISPAVFVPMLESSRQISLLDRFVWEESCRYIAKWKNAGLEFPVSINISRIDLFSDSLFESITSLAEKYSVDRGDLRLEITESAYMSEPERLSRAVDDFRSAGFTVEMDDFGSGYSSLNTLKEINMNVLKLDMKFLDGFGKREKVETILSSITAMAARLNMAVIAEGVESASQADFLLGIGCRYMQGYFFGKPMPADEFELFMQKHRIGRMQIPSGNVSEG